ncbi:Oxidoreductase, short-chain dehydrogenase/reductase family [Olavius algarvensis Delta 1 endosymbiont]|nr:Oxidoreductase, short-chain dehydrogenase/reductase family [Olavius algarvensis Delta 1 endosymbiont]
MAEFKLKDRVAVVTGGSRGIGKGICLAYAREGAHILFSYASNQKAAEETAEEIKTAGVKCFAVQADAGKEPDFVRLRDLARTEFGNINILVANAGTAGKEMAVKDMPVEEWDQLIAVDLRGVFLAAKYFIPLMAADPVGKIINITSELSKKGRANYAHYCAAKGGINGLTRSLALELVPDILVNAIAPGPIETDMIMADMAPEWIEKEKDIPLKRLGTVEEIATTAVLLASDGGNFYCGQILSPNGGAVFF